MWARCCVCVYVFARDLTESRARNRKQIGTRKQATARNILHYVLLLYIYRMNFVIVINNVLDAAQDFFLASAHKYNEYNTI